MRTAKALWLDILELRAKDDPAFSDSLLCGAREEQFQEIEAEAGISIPESFKAFYRIYNGQTETHGVHCFLRNLMLLPLGKILAEWRFHQENDDWEDYEPDNGPEVKPLLWNPRWIPFAVNGGGDCVCLDMDPSEQGIPGQVIYYHHDYENRYVEAPSFFDFIELCINEEKEKENSPEPEPELRDILAGRSPSETNAPYAKLGRGGEYIRIKNPEAATGGNLRQDANSGLVTEIRSGEENGDALDNGLSSWRDVYLQYDFGGAYTVRAIQIYRHIYAKAGPSIFLRCAVELSTTSDFAPGTVITVFPFINLPERKKGAPQILILQEPVSARYIRFWGKGHKGSWGIYSSAVRYAKLEVIAEC